MEGSESRTGSTSYTFCDSRGLAGITGSVEKGCRSCPNVLNAGVVGSSVWEVAEWPELKLEADPALLTERCMKRFDCADVTGYNNQKIELRSMKLHNAT